MMRSGNSKEQVSLPPKILVADDDAAFRKIVMKAAHNTGCVVIQCSNGRRACETLADNPDIDMLVTDVLMPDMDGKQLIRVMRGHQQFAHLPVLILSGVVDSSEVSSILSYGNARFVSKPLKVSKLTEIIEDLLDESRAQSALRPISGTAIRAKTF